MTFNVRLIRRAADAKNRAAQAKDRSIKSALERLAADWIALAEQVERIDREKFPLRDEEICDFADRRPKSVRSEPRELC